MKYTKRQRTKVKRSILIQQALLIVVASSLISLFGYVAILSTTI